MDSRNLTRAEEVAALQARADEAVSSEDWASVADLYQQLIARQPRNGNHRFMLARAYEELGRVGDAIDVFNDPVISGQEKAKKRLARIYIDAKNYAAAMPLVDELVAAHPDDQKFLKWQAVCVERGGGDTDTAERLRRGQQLIEDDRLDEAEQLLTALLSEQPDLSRANMQLGQIYALQKRWPEAVIPLRKGLSRDPNNRKIRNALARVLFKLGDLQGAIEVLQGGEGTETDPDSQLLLQRCYVDLGEWSRASAAAEHLDQLLGPADPLRPEVDQLRRETDVRQQLTAIDRLSESGAADEALPQYQALAEQNPRVKSAWFALSAALADAGRHQEAINAVQQLATALPDDAEVRGALTKLIVESCDEDVILRHIEAAAAEDRPDFEGLRWLARYHLSRDEWPAACACAEGALALQPTSASARALLVQALIHLGEFDRAFAEVSRLLETGEKTTEALRLKGDIFAATDRVDEAIRTYCEALRVFRKDQATTQRLLAALKSARRGEPFPMQGLEDLPLGVGAADIQAAIAPFLGSEASERGWLKREIKVWRGAIDRIATDSDVERDRAIIEREYAVWSTMSFDRYKTDRTTLTGSPWVWRGQKMLLDGAAAARFRTLLFGAAIRQLRPRRVLEVGSGNGINLLSLAGAFPDTEFVGVELTSQGVEQSRRAQSDPDLRAIVKRYTMVDVVDPAAIERIEFIQGDAAQLPFEDGSFDLVMTILAVEQMEKIRAAALSELARVSRGHVMMLEPFRDANEDGLKALYVRSRGYFRGSVSELRDFGVDPVWATTDFPQETYLGSALVLGKKVTGRT